MLSFKSTSKEHSNTGILYLNNWSYELVLVSKVESFVLWVTFLGVKNLWKFHLDWIS